MALALESSSSGFLAVALPFALGLCLRLELGSWSWLLFPRITHYSTLLYSTFLLHRGFSFPSIFFPLLYLSRPVPLCFWLLLAALPASCPATAFQIHHPSISTSSPTTIVQQQPRPAFGYLDFWILGLPVILVSVGRLCWISGITLCEVVGLRYVCVLSPPS